MKLTSIIITKQLINRQETTGNRQQTTNNRHQTTDNRQQSTDNRQQTAYKRQQMSTDPNNRCDNVECGMCDQKHSFVNLLQFL